MPTPSTVKGSERGQAIEIITTSPRKEDFAVLRLWHGKVQARLTPTKREEKEGKRLCLLVRATLSSYPC
jgi:hypothetical protein